MSTSIQQDSQPTTPGSSGKPSNLFGKVLNKLRTPNGGDGSSTNFTRSGEQHTPKRAFSPMLGRRSSSKSSLRMFGGGSSSGERGRGLPPGSSNTSSSSLALDSLGFDEEEDLEMPQFESDKYTAPSNARSSSPYARNYPSTSSLSSAGGSEAPFSEVTAQPSIPSRPGTSMSMRSRTGSIAGEGSSGSGWKSSLLGRSTGEETGSGRSLGRSWTKGKELAKSIGRSTGESSMVAAESFAVDANGEEVTHKVVSSTNEIDTKAPSTRAPLTRLASSERASIPSQQNTYDDGTTPGLPRTGLSRTTAPLSSSTSTNAAASVGRKNWLASRGTASQTIGAVTGKARRVVQRPAPQPMPECQMLMPEEIPEPVSSREERDSPQQHSASKTSPSARPSMSPNGHGRSRSELPPASPKVVQPSDRSAATLTLNSSSYLRKHALDSTRPASSMSQYSSMETSSDRDALPSSSSAASAAASATFAQMRATQALGSTAFRNRFLNSSTSGSLSSSSANNSPDLPSFSSSTASDPSPPSQHPSLPNLPSTLAQNRTQQRSTSNPVKLNPMGSGLTRKNSVSLLSSLDRDDSPGINPRGSAIEHRRNEPPSRAAAQLAAARGSIDTNREPESDEIVPYASRRTSISRSHTSSHDQQQPPTMTASSSTLVGSLGSSLKRSNSETLMASSTSSANQQQQQQPHHQQQGRPGSSMGLYRDDPRQPPPRQAEPLADRRYSPPAEPEAYPAQSHQPQAPAFQPYQDENAYDARSVAPAYSHAPLHSQVPSNNPSFAPHQYPQTQPHQQHPQQHLPPAPPSHSQPHSTLPNGRQVLGEVNRGYGPPPSANPPASVTQQARGYASKPHDYQEPLRDRSPGLAEATPNYTAQQHHYQSQQAIQYQQYRQQGHPGMFYPGQMPMSESHGPEKRTAKPIYVNGKPYQRAGILGKGGSSKVFRVFVPDKGDHTMYALKRVDTRNDKEAKASFENEIDLLKRFRGRNEIIQLIDSEISEKFVYVVLEAGETDLNSLINTYVGKQISLNFIRYIWEQMLSAVSVIHEGDVVHSDLKPANFVLVKGVVKLIDFGISKAIASDTTNIGRDQQIGTANYMPPEALLDSGLGDEGKRLMKLGKAADVWSLGCILYQLVYGHTPFAHLRDLSSKILMIQNPLQRINYPEYSTPSGKGMEALRTKVTPEVLATMKTCLKFYPKERATIPKLLVQPFLRSIDSEPTPPRTTTDPTINESEMAALTQRVAFMLGGQAWMDKLMRNPNENAELAKKLMQELVQLKSA